MEVRERTIWNDFRKQYPNGVVKSICDILLEVVYYLKVDCDKVNVHIINPKVATKIRVVTKKQTKEIKNRVIKKYLILKNTEKGNKEERRQKEFEFRSNTLNKTKRWNNIKQPSYTRNKLSAI